MLLCRCVLVSCTSGWRPRPPPPPPAPAPTLSPVTCPPQDKKTEKDFGKACRQEVKNYEVNAAKDYRLNFRLKKACEDDVELICKDTCSIHEGEVRAGPAGKKFTCPLNLCGHVCT
jgi:hypothetical protein